ncbi:helix-turn-helix domain-containing protein [Salmonella enterica]|nr:helix-turn-helix domain-containing protein [Salmonella enterica]EKY7351263.1 helix-turn-helix domain-containing protein [Salmonella enterica]ELN1909144.1 helix-turn-helix domain-containing protein [Salmonella enterica]
MQLSQYFLERGNAKFLAEKLGISKSYLSQMASGKSAISPERAIEIENHTKGVVNHPQKQGEVSLKTGNTKDILPNTNINTDLVVMIPG